MCNNILLLVLLESNKKDGVDKMDKVNSDGRGDSSAFALLQDYLRTTTMDI